MGERVRAMAEVKVADAGRRYVRKYDGFGRYDLIADLWKQAAHTQPWQPCDFSVSYSEHNGRWEPGLILIDEPGINGVMCTPRIDTSLAVGSNYFTFDSDKWNELGAWWPGERRLFSYDGTENRTSWAESKFHLPPNPVLCLSFYRAGPNTDQDFAANPPYTAIEFGREYALVFPYDGPPLVQWWNPDTGRYEALKSKGKRIPWSAVKDDGGHRKGERSWVWIAALRGHILISSNRFFIDPMVVQVPPHAVWAPNVAPGRIRISNVGGQWWFAFHPVSMQAAYAQSPWMDAGYPLRDNTEPLRQRIRHSPVIGYMYDSPEASYAAKEVTLIDVSSQTPGIGQTQYVWRASFEPQTWYSTEEGPTTDSDARLGDGSLFRTCNSPVLYAALLHQKADIEDRGALNETDVTDDCMLVSGRHDARRAGIYRLRLDNQAGRHTDLGAYRRVCVSLGWRKTNPDENDVTRKFTGYIVEPSQANIAGKNRVEVSLVDGVVMLRDQKCDGRWPVFDGWLISEVFDWVLRRCGIPPEKQDLEELNTTLSEGPPERPLWRVERGRDAWSFLQEVAEFDYNAVVWFDADGTFKKTCRFCRNKRTPDDYTLHDGVTEGGCPLTVDQVFYTRGDKAPDPSEAGEILSIDRPSITLSSRHFANYVAVLGLREDGAPVAAYAADWSSIYDKNADNYVGWPKMQVRALEDYATQQIVNRIAYEKLKELSSRPEYIVIVTPLSEKLNIGGVIQIKGAEDLGVDGRKYRITSIRHEVAPGDPGRWISEIEAKYIGGDA